MGDQFPSPSQPWGNWYSVPGQLDIFDQFIKDASGPVSAKIFFCEGTRNGPKSWDSILLRHCFGNQWKIIYVVLYATRSVWMIALGQVERACVALLRIFAPHRGRNSRPLTFITSSLGRNHSLSGENGAQKKYVCFPESFSPEVAKGWYLPNYIELCHERAWVRKTAWPFLKGSLARATCQKPQNQIAFQTIHGHRNLLDSCVFSEVEQLKDVYLFLLTR